MKLKSTVSFSLKSEDGINAVFTFRKPKLNDALTVDKLPDGAHPNERIKKQCQDALKHLVRVEGLEHEDGTPVKVEEITSLDLDPALTYSIVVGYHEAINKTQEVSEEKKDSASA
jgi:hypothetical protein